MTVRLSHSPKTVQAVERPTNPHLLGWEHRCVGSGHLPDSVRLHQLEQAQQGLRRDHR